MSGKSKNDIAWEGLFDTNGILERVDALGACEISRASINAIRDARLMTSFKHQIQLPSNFKKHSPFKRLVAIVTLLVDYRTLVSSDVGFVRRCAGD